MKNKGFTLIELMIVVAIISILMSIAIPAYQSYVKKATSQACLWEVKGYANEVFLALNDQDDNSIPQAPVMNACQRITSAVGWTVSTQQVIVAIAKSPSNARIECDLPNGSSCKIKP